MAELNPEQEQGPKYPGIAVTLPAGNAVTVPAPSRQVRLAFDAHLASDVYPDYEQARCFCGRGVFASPVPGVWAHLDYMGEFYGHQAQVLAS